MSDRLIGVYENMPFDEYAAVDALNGSSLMHMRRSPMYYRYCEDFPQPPTEDMIVGTVCHTAILEPPLIGKIAVWGTKPEEKVRNGKVWDAFQCEHEDKIILTRSQYEFVTNAVDAVHANPNARKYLAEDGPTEVSMFWVDPGTGMYMKGRLDKIIRGKNSATIVDLKKTRSCNARNFGRQSHSLGYHIKAAIYVSGYQILTGIRPKFKWIAMEAKPPYESAVYRATSDVITLGGEEMLQLVARLKQCQELDNWPPEMEEEEDLILPDYAYADLTDEFGEFAEMGEEG